MLLNTFTFDACPVHCLYPTSRALPDGHFILKSSQLGVFSEDNALCTPHQKLCRFSRGGGKCCDRSERHGQGDGACYV